MPAARRAVPLTAVLVAAALPAAGAAAWVGLAALVTSGPAGLLMLGGLVLTPLALVGAQHLRMAPAARRPLPLPESDRDACPATGRACDGRATR